MSRRKLKHVFEVPNSHRGLRFLASSQHGKNNLGIQM